MHELGHNLGLRHGGVDNTNCKPHHVSVMNYAYQFPNSVPDRPLNYSPLLGVAAPLQCSIPAVTGIGLNEGCLNESLGVGPLYTGKIAYGPLAGVPPKPTIVTAGGAINWDKDTNSAETGISRDLTGMTSSSGGCPTSTTREFLEGSDDWAIIQLNLRASTDFLDGVTASFDPSLVDGTTDINVEDALALSGDLIDIKPTTDHQRAQLGDRRGGDLQSRRGRYHDHRSAQRDAARPPSRRGVGPEGEAGRRLQGEG